VTLALGFAPWILYWVLVSNNTFEEAAVAALVAQVVLLGWGSLHKSTPKLLELGSLLWFALLVVVAFTAEEDFFTEWSYILSNFALTAIVVVSIAVGQPFTRQYAREGVPRELWGSEIFLRSTAVIAWFWLGALVVMSVSTLLTRAWTDEELWFNWIIPIGAFVAAIKFTHWYPDYLQKRAGLAPGS
jgi:hypothetical protein